MWLIELRLEEKLANIESENKVLRQQAVSIAPNKFLSGRSRSILQVFWKNEVVYGLQFNFECLVGSRRFTGYLMIDREVQRVVTWKQGQPLWVEFL